MKYRNGRTNLSATIFVPYDCKNNCPFCTSKADYKDCENFSIIKIAETIERLNKNPLIQEYVITGGEPFASLLGLSYIINTTKKPVYINTTLPSENLDNVIDYINKEDKIKGINISRHMNFDFDCVISVNDMDRIVKSIRINSVIPDSGLSIAELKNFLSKYGKKKRDINLRANYKIMTADKLKTMYSMSLMLSEYLDYICTESCMVCNSEHYSVNDEFICSYHRGLEKSSVQIGNKCYVNDIIVKQNGSVYKDWDCISDEDFNNWVL